MGQMADMGRTEGRHVPQSRHAGRFALPYTPESTLLTEGNRGGIDAEIFVDDDGQAYAFWGMRHVARMGEDMMMPSTIHTITYLTTTRFPLTT